VTKKERHLNRHKYLHYRLDELVADFIEENETKLPSTTTVLELMSWSAAECKRLEQEVGAA
jgi:hypothetical protein